MMALTDRIAEVAVRGLHKMTVYKTATGAWDCTLLFERGRTPAYGHGTAATAVAAMRQALDDAEPKPGPLDTGDIFS